MDMKNKLYKGFVELKKHLKKYKNTMEATRTFNHIKIEGRKYAVILNLKKVDSDEI